MKQTEVRQQDCEIIFVIALDFPGLVQLAIHVPHRGYLAREAGPTTAPRETKCAYEQAGIRTSHASLFGIEPHGFKLHEHCLLRRGPAPCLSSVGRSRRQVANGGGRAAAHLFWTGKPRAKLGGRLHRQPKWMQISMGKSTAGSARAARSSA